MFEFQVSNFYEYTILIAENEMEFEYLVDKGKITDLFIIHSDYQGRIDSESYPSKKVIELINQKILENDFELPEKYTSKANCLHILNQDIVPSG